MRAIVADDHALLREGLIALLKLKHPGWEVGEAASMDELDSLTDEAVDLVLADLDMPGVAGAGSFAVFRENHPGVKVAVLTATDDRAVILDCLGAGVHGYILKSDATSELLRAVQTIVSGGIYVPAKLSRVAALAERPGAPASPAVELTTRQRDVMALLAQGKSTKLIARQLSLAVGTVKVHLGSLYRVLGVHTRMEAVVKARTIIGLD